MKVKPSKSNNKPGSELPYKDAAKVVGGPICNSPEGGLKAEKGVTGSKSLKK